MTRAARVDAGRQHPALVGALLHVGEVRLHGGPLDAATTSRPRRCRCRRARCPRTRCRRSSCPRRRRARRRASRSRRGRRARRRAPSCRCRCRSGAGRCPSSCRPARLRRGCGPTDGPTGPSMRVGPRTTGPAAPFTSTADTCARTAEFTTETCSTATVRAWICCGRGRDAQRVHLERLRLHGRASLGDDARVHDLRLHRLDGGREREVAPLRERLRAPARARRAAAAAASLRSCTGMIVSSITGASVASRASSAKPPACSSTRAGQERRACARRHRARHSPDRPRADALAGAAAICASGACLRWDLASAAADQRGLLHQATGSLGGGPGMTSIGAILGRGGHVVGCPRLRWTARRDEEAGRARAKSNLREGARGVKPATRR